MDCRAWHCRNMVFASILESRVCHRGFGTALVMIGTAIPRWRLDEHGTKPLENVWSFSGFESKSYGLMTATCSILLNQCMSMHA